jgi:hypothetical protein
MVTNYYLHAKIIQTVIAVLNFSHDEYISYVYIRGGRGRDRMVAGFTTIPMQSVHITTNIASSNPSHGDEYPIHHYGIKFVSELQQALISSTNNTVESGVKHHSPNPYMHMYKGHVKH